MAQRQLHELEDRIDVDLHHPVELRQVVVGERLADVDAGVVDHDVQAVTPAKRGGEHPVHRVGIAQVRQVAGGFDAVLGNLFPRFLQLVGIGGGEEQIGAFGGVGAGDGSSDAAAGTGDQGVSAFQTVH